jgi:hypothetical protein
LSSDKRSFALHAEQAYSNAQTLLDLVNYIGVGEYLSSKGQVSAGKQAQIDEALRKELAAYYAISSNA